MGIISQLDSPLSSNIHNISEIKCTTMNNESKEKVKEL